MIKEANRRPPHATGTLFPSRNQYTPSCIITWKPIFSIEGIEVNSKINLKNQVVDNEGFKNRGADCLGVKKSPAREGAGLLGKRARLLFNSKLEANGVCVFWNNQWLNDNSGLSAIRIVLI
jgi:hypothetical protein